MTESMWNGFRRLDFEFEGREAILVFPNKTNPDNNWLFKTEYFDAFPNFEIQMLELGWHLAYVKNITRWCLEEDLDLKKRFSDYIISEYGLCEKCVPVGMSCGGLIGSRFAEKYPDYVCCLYLDAPVLNLLSCPAGLGKGHNDMFFEFVEATGITQDKLICLRNSPIDHMSVLLENDIPIIIVYGDCDDIVPYSENGLVLEEYYRQNGGCIKTICKPGCGHHPHGLEDNTPIIEFVQKMQKL